MVCQTDHVEEYTANTLEKLAYRQENYLPTYACNGNRMILYQRIHTLFSSKQETQMTSTKIKTKSPSTSRFDLFNMSRSQLKFIIRRPSF